MFLYGKKYTYFVNAEIPFPENRHFNAKTKTPIYMCRSSSVYRKIGGKYNESENKRFISRVNYMEISVHHTYLHNKSNIIPY